MTLSPVELFIREYNFSILLRFFRKKIIFSLVLHDYLNITIFIYSMNKNKFVVGLMTLVCTTVMLASCNKERTVLNTNGADLYQSFMPLEIGKYIIYDVDSSIWDDNLCIKFTRKSQQEYLVVDTFRDLQKRLSYVINVNSRLTASGPFVKNDVIYYTPGAEQLEFVEKNIRFMRLVNPISEGKQWAGNSLVPSEDQDYNYLKGWKYTYSDVLKPYNNGSISFEKTLTVNETNQIVNNPETQSSDYAYLLQSKSVYAYRVGMIYREYAYWIYDPTASSKPCRKGVGVVMRAIEYN